MAVTHWRLPCARCARLRILDVDTELCVTPLDPDPDQPPPPLAARVTCYEWVRYHDIATFAVHKQTKVA